jgi:hypothetical protein
MSWNSDFDKFLADQKQGKQKYGNLSERKEQWLSKIDVLYGQVTDLLRDYLAHGRMELKRSTTELREEHLGAYQAPTMTINLGASSVQFVPIGTMLLGSPGRVDLVGIRSSVRFVLVLPGNDRPLFSVTTTFGESPRVSKSSPLDLAPYEWKISSQPPGIRYSPIDTSSLQSAIMEAANGHARRR